MFTQLSNDGTVADRDDVNSLVSRSESKTKN